MAQIMPDGSLGPTWTRVDEMARQYKRMLKLYPEVTKQRLLDGGLSEQRIWLLDRLAECAEPQIEYLQEKYRTFKAFNEAVERGEEFSKDAQEAYRANWLAYQKEDREEVKRALQEAMDRLQPAICPGPGPMWDEFSATLPGYREYWAMFAITAAESLFGRIDAAQEELARGYTNGGGQVHLPDSDGP
jgi:tetratricopeptide (TPR) repeat protein